MSVELTVEDAIAYLCKATTGNFYAYLLNTLERIYTYSVSTFCVMPKGTRYVMMINPEFAGKQPFERLVAIIEHEILHIVLNHAPRGLAMYHLCETDADRRYFMLAKPLAADAAVNEIVRQNHKMEVLCPKIDREEDEDHLVHFILPERYNMPNGGSYDGYTALLMSRFRKMISDPEKLIEEVVSQLKKQIEDAGGVQPGSILAAVAPKVLQGSAEKPGDGEEEKQDKPQPVSELEARLIKDLVRTIGEHLSEYIEDATDPAKGKHLETHGKELVRTAARDYQKSRGTLPSQIAQLIEAFLQAPTVSWTELLAALVHNAQKSRLIRGMRRVSKMKAALQMFFKHRVRALSRVPLFPGTERDNKFVVWFVVDTSGSMSIADMAAGLSELQHIQRSASDMEIHVLYVDAGVGKYYQIGPNDPLDYNMTGRGGTDFEVAFAYVAEHAQHIDLMVYATDGYAPRPTTKLACHTVWLITASGRSDMYNQAGHTVLQMREYGVGETL